MKIGAGLPTIVHRVVSFVPLGKPLRMLYVPNWLIQYTHLVASHIRVSTLDHYMLHMAHVIMKVTIFTPYTTFNPCQHNAISIILLISILLLISICQFINYLT